MQVIWSTDVGRVKQVRAMMGCHDIRVYYALEDAYKREIGNMQAGLQVPH
jgi:hypothetical protein